MIEFKKEVLDNDFYNLMSSTYLYEHRFFTTRKNMKDNVMFWLTGSYQNRKVIQWLNDRYPSITNYIQFINQKESVGTKMIFGKRLPKKNGLAIKLMKSESYLVNNLIINNLSTNHPNSICYGIFDGLVIEPKYVDELKQIVKDNGNSYLGFTPKIKIEAITDHILGDEQIPLEKEIVEPQALEPPVIETSTDKDKTVEQLLAEGITPSQLIGAGKITINQYLLMDDSILNMPKTLNDNFFEEYQG